MYRDADGALIKNKDRAILHDMDQLPFVTEVYPSICGSRTISSAT